MQPQVQSQPDAKPEEKIMQPQQVVQVQPQNGQVQVAKVSEEASPPIKSEENQANWKNFRERRELERKAREDAERRAAEKAAEAEALKQAMEALVNKKGPSIASDEHEETDEDRIERKVQAALRKERELMQREMQEREAQEAPKRILQMHPDFNQVVTTENCDYIDYHYPELAAPFRHMPDGIEKWDAMYKTIKRFIPNADSRKDAARAEKNLSKPGSASTTSAAQTSGAPSPHSLTEERRKANWERMQRQLKGLS